MVKLAHNMLRRHALFLEQLIESAARIIAFFSLAFAWLEQPVNILAHVIALHRFTPPLGQGQPVIRLEVITVIDLDLIPNVVGLRFAALVALPRVKETTVLAAMNVGFAMRTLVAPLRFADQFHLASTIVTNHKLFAGIFLDNNRPLERHAPVIWRRCRWYSSPASRACFTHG
jgi:hypothetical protein